MKGFTIEQMIEGRKLKVLKRFKKDKADVSGKKKRKEKGWYCPAK
jgi:hypothetical protein